MFQYCDEIIAQCGKYKYALIIDKNVLSIQTMRYNLCKLSVYIDYNTYDIRITYNSNEENIKNFNDIKPFVEKLNKYFAKLINLYNYMNQNYNVLQLDNLTKIVVIHIDESCHCGCTEYIKYTLDCDENNFFLFEENYKNKKIFSSIEQIEAFENFSSYKKQQEKFLCCC